jgi:predicted DNA-binding transcriptional regulator AlpA
VPQTDFSVKTGEGRIMHDAIEPLLTITDVMKIFSISQPTVYRWLALARRGESRFPLPVGGRKQKLRWSRESILAFQNANNPQPPNIESASERNKRHRAAMERLRSKGVKITSK